MKVLLDTDVVLDLILNWEPFSTEASEIWNANIQGKCQAYISGITPVNVFYIVRKAQGISAAQFAVESIQLNLEICPINKTVLESARQSSITDFEDAVQHASALLANLNCVVTRNIKDYNSASLPVYKPADFLALLP